MADTISDGGFWLPSEFLSDDDFLMDKENLTKYGGVNTVPATDCSFPSVFPYKPIGSSSVHGLAVEGSGETECDEKDLLAGLARQLGRSSLQETQRPSSNSQNIKEKPWKLSAVEIGHSNGARSALSSEDSWCLIPAAVGPRGKGLHGPPHALKPAHPPFKETNLGFYPNPHYPGLDRSTNCDRLKAEQVVKQHGSPIWGRQAEEKMVLSQQNLFQQLQMFQNRGGVRGGRSRGLNQSGLPHLHVQHHQNPNHPQNFGGSGMRTGLPAASRSGVRKESSGTGVFLPRRYANPSETRGKPSTIAAAVASSGYSTALMPALPPAQPNNRARPNDSLALDYDVLVAQRNAILKQQRGGVMRSKGEWEISHEVQLPTEWTY